MSWAVHAKAALRAGQNVTINPRGNSMTPRVVSGATVDLIPVVEATPVAAGDVVLAHVRGRDFLHLVKAIRGNQYQIANNHGHVNGWVTKNAIYGLAVRIQNKGETTDADD